MTVPQRIRDSAEQYEKKNDDYGDSWRKVGEILYNLANGEPVVLETVEDHIAYGLYTRRLDKVSRAFTGEMMAEDLNFESVEDSHGDDGVYAQMAAENVVDRSEE